MENQEKMKGSNIEYHPTVIAALLNTNAQIRTLIDVLIETHLHGKSDQERNDFIKLVDDKHTQNLDLAIGLGILGKREKK
jgi:hypothetical protein